MTLATTFPRYQPLSLRKRIHDAMQRIMFPLGQPVKAANIWWTNNGAISSSDVACVWQPKGAESLAASYLRIAGTGGYAILDPAIVGSGVAPGFDTSQGWLWNGSAWLNSGWIPTNQPGQNRSVIIRFTSLAGWPGAPSVYSPYGSQQAFDANDVYISIALVNPTFYGVAFVNGGTYQWTGDTNPTGGDHIYGVCGDRGYLDGTEYSPIPAWVGVQPNPLYIGRFTPASSSICPTGTSMAAIAVYNRSLTQAEYLGVRSLLAAI